MIIGGFQPVTLLDYPQKVAAIIFTSGCNMRCPFCYNYKLVLPEYINQEKETFFDEQQILTFLKNRRRYLDGLVITGGEPTIQKDLINFLLKVKELNYIVKLDTNGLLPEALNQLISQKLIDYIAMDIKGPIDENYYQYSGVNGVNQLFNIKNSIKIIMNSGLPYEFRTTLVKELHKFDDAVKIAQEITGAQLYFLQMFKDESTLDSQAKFSNFTLEEMEQMRLQCEKFVIKCLIR